MYVRRHKTPLLLNRIRKSTLLPSWQYLKFSQIKVTIQFPRSIIAQPQNLRKTIFTQTWVSMKARVKMKNPSCITPRVVHLNKNQCRHHLKSVKTTS